jgi:hypothetical protein
MDLVSSAINLYVLQLMVFGASGNSVITRSSGREGGNRFAFLQRKLWRISGTVLGPLPCFAPFLLIAPTVG